MSPDIVSAHPQESLSMPAALEWLRWVRALWRRALQLSHRQPRRLRLCESLPLGERRFVAVVEFENSRFLLGGTSASMVLLARLEGNSTSGKIQPILTSEQEER